MLYLLNITLLCQSMCKGNGRLLKIDLPTCWYHHRNIFLPLYTACSCFLNTIDFYNRLNGGKLLREAANCLTHLCKMNMHSSYIYLMYGKYLLFCEFSKILHGYFAHVQTVVFCACVNIEYQATCI